jgi:hypothetical protein
VGRVDNAYGDRNIMCSRVPLSSYERAVPEPADTTTAQ